jgi:hypothetical protein
MSGEDTYFIQIENQHEIRRGVLENLRDTVTSLQALEGLKETRVAIVEKNLELKKIMSEIRTLNSNLRKHLPKVKEPVVAVSKPVRKGAKKSHHVKAKPKGDLTRLEQELDAIEEKLNSLSRK